MISEFEEAQADLRWGHPITDEAATHWSQLMYEAYPAVTAVTGEDEHLELCYMVDVAKFADQQTRASRQAEPLFPRAGEHLCVLIYAAMAQRGDTLLTTDKVQKHWLEVVAAIKQELETWAKYGCIRRKNANLHDQVLAAKWVVTLMFEQDGRSVHEGQESGPTVTRRVIRARLTVRAFKSIDARTLDIYAGAS